MARTRGMGTAFAIAFAILVVDQALKRLVEGLMQVGQSVALVPGVLELTYAKNPGGAFGTLQGQGAVPLLGSLLAVAVVLWILFSGKPSRPATVGCGLVLGGTAGNLLDRVVAGQVTDYLQLVYVFNAADLAIIAGVGTLLVAALGGREHGGD